MLHPHQISHKGRNNDTTLMSHCGPHLAISSTIRRTCSIGATSPASEGTLRIHSLTQAIALGTSSGTEPSTWVGDREVTLCWRMRFTGFCGSLFHSQVAPRIVPDVSGFPVLRLEVNSQCLRVYHHMLVVPLDSVSHLIHLQKLVSLMIV